ncbi:hypothetical protein NHQ30_000722 [Ciborinia camelliae]|nr:hypothetical protein NHQ30_000722 [Ciborinia camelliae]
MASIKVSLSLPNTAKFEDPITQHSDGLFITLPEEIDNHTIDFEGPDDQSNPLNWPLWYKWTLIIVLSSVNTIANLATVLCLPAAPQILRDFHTNDNIYITIIASIWELGEAVGALLTSPLSEIFGRAPVYNVTNTIFVVFSIASGLSTSPGMLIGFRFLNGMGDASISLNSSIAGDLFVQEERGLPIAILSFPPLIGPVLGPIIGGYLTQSAGWRWAFWFSAITGGVFEIAFFFVFRETYAPKILRNKAQKLRKETGNMNYHSRFDFDTRAPGIKILRDGLVRPVSMFFSSPSVFILSIQVSIAYGYMYILFTTLTPVFEQTYGFSQGAAGLSFIGLSMGMVLGVAVCALTLDRLLKKFTNKSGVFRPEIRLVPMAVGGALFPLGLFFYGWTAQYHVFYVVPMIGTATVGLGYFITNIPLQAYLVDIYHEYAASAVGATVVLRCIFATVIPLGALPLYDKLGLGWGNSVLGFIAVLFIPVPLLLMRFGERLRNSTKIMSAPTTPPTKHEWLVILPDHEGVLQKRLEARPKHLAGVKPLAEAGALLFGGAFFDDLPPDGETPQIKGTVLLAYAESKEKVLEQLRLDEYTKSGVWDWDKVQIYGFKTALRKGLEGGI